MVPLILFGGVHDISCGIGSGSWGGVYSGGSSGNSYSSSGLYNKKIKK